VQCINMNLSKDGDAWALKVSRLDVVGEDQPVMNEADTVTLKLKAFSKELAYSMATDLAFRLQELVDGKVLLVST